MGNRREKITGVFQLEKEKNSGNYFVCQPFLKKETFSMPNISHVTTLCDFGIFPALNSSSSIKNVTLQTLLVMTNIVVSLFGTLANGLVIMAYYRNRRLRTVQNTIFMLLAITDFSVTAFVQPIYVISILSGLLGNNICILQLLFIILSFLFVGLSLVTIVILSLQSFITLAYPYHYQSIITKRRLIVVFVVSWLFVLLKSLAFFHLPDVVYHASYCIVFVTVFVVVVTWCWTCKLVARHRKAIQNTQTPSSNENMAKKKVLRSTITAFAIILGLVACYFLDLCFFIFKNYLNASRLGHSTFVILWSLAMTLVHLNSLVNPCLVFWRNTAFRQAVENIF